MRIKQNIQKQLNDIYGNLNLFLYSLPYFVLVRIEIIYSNLIL